MKYSAIISGPSSPETTGSCTVLEKTGSLNFFFSHSSRKTNNNENLSEVYVPDCYWLFVTTLNGPFDNNSK